MMASPPLQPSFTFTGTRASQRASLLQNFRALPRMKRSRRTAHRRSQTSAQNATIEVHDNTAILFSFPLGPCPADAMPTDCSPSHFSGANFQPTIAKKRNSDRPGKSKSVRFDERLNQAHENTTGLCKEDYREECWFSRDDIREFKTMASFLAQDFRKLDHSCQLPFSYGRILQHTYRACLSSSSSFQASALPDDRTVLTPSEEKILRDRLQSTIAILGLDRQVVSGLVHDILCRRQEMITLIREVQQLKNDRNPDFADNAELIRTCCEQTSRPSRLYAAHVGRALASESDS